MTARWLIGSIQLIFQAMPVMLPVAAARFGLSLNTSMGGTADWREIDHQISGVPAARAEKVAAPAFANKSWTRRPNSTLIFRHCSLIRIWWDQGSSSSSSMQLFSLTHWNGTTYCLHFLWQDQNKQQSKNKTRDKTKNLKISINKDFFISKQVQQLTSNC